MSSQHGACCPLPMEQLLTKGKLVEVAKEEERWRGSEGWGGWRTLRGNATTARRLDLSCGVLVSWFPKLQAIPAKAFLQPVSCRESMLKGLEGIRRTFRDHQKNSWVGSCFRSNVSWVGVTTVGLLGACGDLPYTSWSESLIGSAHRCGAVAGPASQSKAGNMTAPKLL